MKTNLKKTAQNIQDNIFKKMSADKRVKIGAYLWKLGRDLAPNKIIYARRNRPKKVIN